MRTQYSAADRFGNVSSCRSQMYGTDEASSGAAEQIDDKDSTSSAGILGLLRRAKMEGRRPGSSSTEEKSSDEVVSPFKSATSADSAETGTIS